MIVDALAPTFGGEKNFIQSLKLTAYSYTAAWIAGIFQLIPFLGGILSLLGAVYAWYTFYLGVAVMKKCPPGEGGCLHRGHRRVRPGAGHGAVRRPDVDLFRWRDAGRRAA